MSKETRPSSLWKVGDEIEMLDAWMANPRNGKIVYIPNEHHVVMECSKGIRHYGHTDRIISSPPTDITGFEDLLG